MELSNIGGLQKTADYMVSTRALKGRWRTSIIVGVLGIVSGILYSILFSPVNAILILLGVLLVIAGINARIASKPRNMILTAVALLAMGGWSLIVVATNFYIFFTYYSGYTAPTTLTWGIFLGLFCLLWGATLLIRYRHTSSVVPNKPSDQMLGQVENLVKPIIHAKVKSEQDIIEFVGYYGGGLDATIFRAKLNKTSATIASKNGTAIFFVRPDEFQITETEKRVGITKRHYFDGRIRDSKFTISIITPLSLTRYENWKKSMLTPTQS
jgi:hypothetical protein